MKTHYLGGKRNQRVNSIVRTLVLKVVPDFDFKHRQQLTNMKGLNLNDSHHRRVEASARNISPDSIHYVDGTTFYVASQSLLGHYYLIDMTQSACDCKDFPRIRYCKHIAAIDMHFPQLCPKGNSSSKIPERMYVPDMPERKHTPRSEEESTEIILKDISALCQQLSAVSNHSTLDLQALKVIKRSLKMAIALANGSQALPEKDVFNANQKTWAETAEHMGQPRKASKCTHGPVSGNTATEHIGHAKGKRSRKYTDPYAGGKRSGKCAKPDVVSAAANTVAHTAVPAPALHVPAVLAPAHASPSAAAAGSAAHSFTFANPSGVVLLAYPPSSSRPGLAFAPFSAALLRSAFAPPSAAGTGFGYAGTSAQTTFRADIMPRNARARMHLPPGLDFLT